jgi:hypothetical protein
VLQFAHRTLVLCKRGTTPFLRLFVKDFLLLVPSHVYAETSGDDRSTFNGEAESLGCDHIILFETHPDGSSLMSVAAVPSGPTAVFQIVSAHRIEELRLAGKCHPAGRRILQFDPSFDSRLPYAIVKELLRRCCSGQRTENSPDCFVDSCVTFVTVGSQVWTLLYQVPWEFGLSIVFEAGPRLCLELLMTNSGSFCGDVLYRNPQEAQ